MIIGLGTGRCGTENLSRILDLPHEGCWLSWNPRDTLYASVLPRAIQCGGDVGLYWLRYVPWLVRDFPDTKFVCLQRDREKVVRSWLSNLNGRNVFTDQNWSAAYHDCFPRYEDGTSIEDGVRRYWTDYYAIAYSFQRAYPASFRIFSASYALGEGLEEMKNFCGASMSQAHPMEHTIRQSATTGVHP